MENYMKVKRISQKDWAKELNALEEHALLEPESQYITHILKKINWKKPACLNNRIENLLEVKYASIWMWKSCPNEENKRQVKLILLNVEL